MELCRINHNYITCAFSPAHPVWQSFNKTCFIDLIWEKDKRAVENLILSESYHKLIELWSITLFTY